MIGFAKFRDDLETIRRYIERSFDAPAGAYDARAALARVEAFARTLENLDVHTLPEPPPAEPKGPQP